MTDIEQALAELEAAAREFCIPTGLVSSRERLQKAHDNLAALRAKEAQPEVELTEELIQETKRRIAAVRTTNGTAEELAQDLEAVWWTASLVEQLRAKEARENALYAPQWTDDDLPIQVMSLKELKEDFESDLTYLRALHPFDKEEGRYTGEIITGDALAELLEDKQ